MGKKLTEEEKELWREAVKRYPIGTKFRIAHYPSVVVTVTSHKRNKDSFVYSSVDGKVHVNLFGTGGDTDGASVYWGGEWAEIVEYPIKNIVDELDEKIKAMEKRLGGKS